MEINDTNFVTQLKKKNRRALEFAMEAYGNLVYSIVRKVLQAGFGNSYVEECLNVVFLSIWNNMESFDETKGNFQSWIAAVSKYKAIDYQRKLSKRDSVEWTTDRELSAELTLEIILVVSAALSAVGAGLSLLQKPMT